MDCSPPGSSVHGILQARILEWVASHSLLQGNFPTQGSNPGLPHCRQTLNHLSHQGIGHLLTWRVHLSVSYLFAFSYCSWSQSKKTEVVCRSFLQWTTFYQNSSPWPIHHVAPRVALHGMAHSFIELDKAVVHVISLINFLWLWFSFCLPSDR